MTMHETPGPDITITSAGITELAADAQAAYDGHTPTSLDVGKGPVVANTLADHGRMSRAELARVAGTGISTLTSIVSKLEEADLAVKGPKISNNHKAGRPVELIDATEKLPQTVHNNPYWDHHVGIQDIAERLGIHPAAAEFFAVYLTRSVLDLLDAEDALAQKSAQADEITL